MRLIASVVLSAGLASSAENVWPQREEARMSLAYAQMERENNQTELAKEESDRRAQETELTGMEDKLRSHRATLVELEGAFQGHLQKLQSIQPDEYQRSPAVMKAPLAADWELDEPAGATLFADASGNGNAGSCGSSCPSLGVGGEVRTAASFNSSGQIIVPDSPSLRLNQFTIALWVFPTQVTQTKSAYQPLLAKEDSFGANRNYGLYIVPNSLQVRYSVWAGDCATKLAANSSWQMALNTWNQIVFTYDGATEKLYLNGVLDSSNAAPAAGLCQAAEPVKIGMETSAFLPFSGTLDDVQIYSQALTAVQVWDLFSKSLL